MRTRILYVEDEPFLGRIVRESLESRGFEVTMTTDGSRVTDLFTEIKPDICILDVMLPHKDGFSIAKDIRAIGVEIPIIFVTAKTQTEDLVKGFDSGGNDYIRKPFSMEELIVRIQNLLKIVNAKSSASTDLIQIGQYQFFPNRYELCSHSSSRKLSHRESTLLQMLNENRNRTTLRKEILLKLWGDDSFFNSRNLDVYITKLRDYLKEDKSIQIITIKGIGYHFTTG
jgi:two-component system, OmpR family, response regulator VicR